MKGTFTCNILMLFFYETKSKKQDKETKRQKQRNKRKQNRKKTWKEQTQKWRIERDKERESEKGKLNKQLRKIKGDTEKSTKMPF